MTSDQEAPGSGATRDEIEADIEQTRQDLGETVSALGDKFDVKSQAQNRARSIQASAQGAAEDTRRRVNETVTGFRQQAPVPPAVGAVVVVTVIVALIVWRRSR